jgi:3-hydroxybutyryl-CoA dehydrogenase
MKATVVSKSNNICDELKEKLNAPLRYASKDTMLEVINKENTEIVFCTDLKVPVKRLIELQKMLPEITIVFNAVNFTIENLRRAGINTAKVIGMNLLPTFINRALAEITLDEKQPCNTQVLEQMGWEIKLVKSRVGLVTPRVIFMIVNEAYFTVQEGTASKEDIDTGMKLGTNYPKGPFEWSQEIGLKNIYQTLKAMYEDTKEGRYKICPMLKKEALG